MKAALIALLLVHGAIHLLGFVKAFAIADIARLHEPIGRPVGVLWLVAAFGLFASAALVVVAPGQWTLVAAPAVILSQILIVTSFHDAKAGTLANLALLVAIVPSVLELRPSSLTSSYREDVRHTLVRRAVDSPVTEADLALLPAQIQTYLRRVGVVGKPRVHDVRSRWRGQMRSKPGAAWMDVTVEQHDFFDEPARLFLMNASLHGIPFVALHRYVGAHATMQVRVASLVDVVDARGPEMDRSETVTLFNDLCWLAPAALVDANVQWQEVDRRVVRGIFTNAGHTIAAELSFDDQGDLVGFVSRDRYQSADGKTYERFPWSTPLGSYRDIGGLRLATHGEAIWQQPSGDLVYARFDLEELDYNVAAQVPVPIPSTANPDQRLGAF